MVKNGDDLENDVHDVPERIDRTISRIKLKALGVSIDALTPEQKKYLNSWQVGT